MSDGINVRLSGKLRKFVNAQTGEDGLFENVSEYIRSLIRQDYERDENRKWSRLHQELSDGINADEAEFEYISLEDIKSAAKEFV